MTTKQFRQVALIGRVGKDIGDTLDAVYDFLNRKKINLFVEKNTAAMMSRQIDNIFSDTHIPKKTDLMIVIGGDGSLLHAAHLALPHQIPVLGVNRGKLGFLTDIHPDHLDKITAVLNGKYTIEKRFLLQATLNKKTLGVALNDVVLLPGDNAQMIEFDMRVDGNLVCQQRADGMIVATPTGSTAYALSGGGPILHPQLNAIALVPMFPHTLSSRPIVVDGDAVIELVVHNTQDAKPALSCDGEKRIFLKIGDTVRIQKIKQSLQLIHPKDYDYYKTLREKLGWQARV